MKTAKSNFARHRLVAIACAAVAIVAIAVFLTRFISRDRQQATGQTAETAVAGSVGSEGRDLVPGMASPGGVSKSEGRTTGKPRPRRARFAPDDYSEYQVEDRATMRELDDAWDDEDFERVLSASKKALKSSDRDVREAAMEALNWFGRDALPAMTLFLADPDTEIASMAAWYWAGALDEVEDEELKASMVESVMSVVTDEEILDDISEQLSYLKDITALQAIINIIDGDNVRAADAARKVYKSITGDEFSTLEAAEEYLLAWSNDSSEYAKAIGRDGAGGDDGGEAPSEDAEGQVADGRPEESPEGESTGEEIPETEEPVADEDGAVPEGDDDDGTQSGEDTEADDPESAEPAEDDPGDSEDSP